MNSADGKNNSASIPSSAGDSAKQTHMLLTVLGKNSRPARYTLNDREIEATLAPVALLNLLPESARPGLVVALCTPEAECESWPLLEKALNGRSQVKLVRVCGGDTQDQVNVYLESVACAVPRGAEITVDVTHGFRHFSFLTYIAVLYLAALRGVRVRGAYYGMLNQDRPSPFLDLRPIVELPDWLYALRALRDTGSVRPIAEALGASPQDQLDRRIACRLSRLSKAHLSGLPIELGRQAHDLLQKDRKPLQKRLARDHRLPLADELVKWLEETLTPLALAAPASGKGWKGQVRLTKPELERQAKVIDNLLWHGSVATAIGLMSEWTVSWVLLHLYLEKEWLNFKLGRRKASGLLGATQAIERDPELRRSLTEEQRELGKFWRKLSKLRNGYAHHGMRKQDLVGDYQSKHNFRHVRKYWKETLCRHPDFFPLLGWLSNDRVLVSPIGKRPGVLFSALQACRATEDVGEPKLCLVICSRETEGKIVEATTRASYKDEIKPLCLEDPYGGRLEIERLAKKARPHFIGAGEVLVNVTGGTTLMGLAAEALADAARKLACPVRRFGLIDRRHPKEQDRDPYRVGEPFWLDSGENTDVDQD